MKEFVNREKEKVFLEAEFYKDSASFVVIYGRRRIGKTSLIKEFIIYIFRYIKLQKAIFLQGLVASCLCTPKTEK